MRRVAPRVNAAGRMSSPDIAALPAQLKPLTDLFRKQGGLIGATLFTLVPGRGGEPGTAEHRQIRPPIHASL